MNVALESSSLFFKNYTGIPFYIHNLFTAMQDIAHLDPILAFRLKNRFNSKSKFQRDLLANEHVWHIQDRILCTKSIHVAHSLHTPFLNTKKSVRIATVHDLAVHLPQFKSYDFSSAYFKKKRFELFQEFTNHADAIITVSMTTKIDFLDFFDFPEERVHVVPLAPSRHVTTNNILNTHNIIHKFGLEAKSYFISLGGISLRKNTYNLVRAYHLSKSQSKFKLVITGKIEEPQGRLVQEFIAKHNLKNSILITGYIEKEELAVLYQEARAFLFPTFYEGFGIPILEAMKARLPVLTSISGAAPETAGGHAILVDPFKVEDISDGIDKLQNITTAQLDKAKSYADIFTWNQTAQMTKKIYDKYV